MDEERIAAARAALAERLDARKQALPKGAVARRLAIAALFKSRARIGGPVGGPTGKARKIA